MVGETVSVQSCGQNFQDEAIQPNFLLDLLIGFSINVLIGVDQKTDDLFLESVVLFLGEFGEHFILLVKGFDEGDHFGGSGLHMELEFNLWI